MRVRFTPEAINSAREKHAWWSEHRQEAPRLFADELAAVIARLRLAMIARGVSSLSVPGVRCGAY